MDKYIDVHCEWIDEFDELIKNPSKHTDKLGAMFRLINFFNAISKTRVFEAQTLVQLGCEFIQNMAKFQCCVCGF